MDQPNHFFSPIETLVMTNSAAADIISSDQDGLDESGADLILRNLAVATDRLTAGDFAKLPQEVRDQVFAVAFMADDIAPIQDEDMVRRPDEDDQTYDYRTGIWQRIHNLQAYVYTHSNDSDDPGELSKLRFAVHGAGLAFAAIMEATEDVPAIAETVRYFQGNTNAAARRAAHISELAISRAASEE